MWNIKSLLHPTLPFPLTSDPSAGRQFRSSPNVRGVKSEGNTLLSDLPPGERARIACLDCPHASSCERLTAYGLAQGQSILLVQKRPTFVIRVDETELAFDELVARCIQVKRSGKT